MKLTTTILFLISLNISAVSPGDVQNILNRNNCMGCHGSGSSYGDFVQFSTNEAWGKSRFISPKDPNNSPLINRLKNFGGTASDMPKGSFPNMSNTDYITLRAWVNELKVQAVAVDDNDTETDANIGINRNSLQAQKIIYKRCYEQMVRRPLEPSSSLFMQVAAGSKTGPDACLELLKRATLWPKSGGKVELNDNDVAKEVFDTFFEFHASWFNPVDYTSAFGFGATESRELFEFDQPALYLSRALHGVNVPYEYILTSNDSLKSVRSTNTNYTPSYEFRYDFEQRVRRGRILGIDTHYEETVDSHRGPVRQRSNDNGSFDVFQHQGGGLLGSQTYIIQNAGSRLPYFSDGGAKVLRTLSKNYFSQVLCRELPVVRAVDAVSFVDSTSNLPWRNGVACMQCHSSIDRFAWSGRKVYSTLSPGKSIGQDRSDIRTAFVNAHPDMDIEDNPSFAWPEGDNQFHRKAPWGKLYFRSHDGSLVNESVKGFDGLGQALANEDAPYVCAAKRYMKFFTGVDANIGDIDHILSETELSEKERYYRNFVVKLGRELKDHQSLEQLFYRIFSSKAYIKPGLGVE